MSDSYVDFVGEGIDIELRFGKSPTVHCALEISNPNAG